MAEVDKLKSEVASISERFERLESLVEKFSEQQVFRRASVKLKPRMASAAMSAVDKSPQTSNSIN